METKETPSQNANNTYNNKENKDTNGSHVVRMHISLFNSVPDFDDLAGFFVTVNASGAAELRSSSIVLMVRLGFVWQDKVEHDR